MDPHLRSGCAETPEPINPTDGNEAWTEPDDYRSGDGRLRLSRNVQQRHWERRRGTPYQLGVGWQHNFMGRHVAAVNTIASLLPQYAVSKNYSSPQNACTEGWGDVAPGQTRQLGSHRHLQQRVVSTIKRGELADLHQRATDNTIRRSDCSGSFSGLTVRIICFRAKAPPAQPVPASR